MRKFNIQNYVRYKEDVEKTIKTVKKRINGNYTELTNDETIKVVGVFNNCIYLDYLEEILEDTN